MQHVKYLDGWRGLAISCVYLSHFLPLPGFSFGRFGVDLFFVLSGRLMSEMLFEARTPLPTFYRRRASRILPVFVLFIGVMILMAIAMDLSWPPGEILSSVFFLRTYLPETPIWSSAVPIGHFWSLNVEEHSYVFLALIAAVPLLRNREGWFLLAMAALSLMITAWYWKNPAIAPDDYPLRTECAAVGLLLSAAWRQVRRYFASLIRPWMAPIALLFGASCYLWAAPSWTKLLIAPFFLAFALNEIGDSYRVLVRALEWKPICIVGVWSYSLYLWQQPLYTFAKDGKLHTALAFALAVSAGLLSFYFFERPTRDWLNKNWGRKSTPMATTTVVN